MHIPKLENENHRSTHRHQGTNNHRNLTGQHPCFFFFFFYTVEVSDNWRERGETPLRETQRQIAT
jgi:hypothetical protein